MKTTLPNPLNARKLLLATSVAACLLTAGCAASFQAQTAEIANAGPSSARFAYVANVADSTISMYTVASSGQWTPTSPATVASGPQPEAITVDSQGKFAYVCNIGNSTIGMFAINQSTGVLTPLSPANASAGALPQDFTLHPSGNFAYSANTSGGTVTVFSVNKITGQLTPTATVPVPGYNVANPVAVTVSPSGQFLYVVAQYVEIYSIDQTTGGLTILPETYTYPGVRPFKLTFDSTGQFAFIPDNGSNNLYEFAANPTTGALTALASSPVNAGNQPSGVALSPVSNIAYVSDRLGNTVSSFDVASSTGQLTPLSPNAATNTNGPWPIQFDPSGKIVYVLNEAGFVTSYTANPDGTLTYVASVATGKIPASFAIVPLQ
jgi:6-phosphogluconolactonase (cycloisomerase 2 family)